MTGVGIRAFELARVLQRAGRVRIAAPDSVGVFGGIEVLPYEHRRPHALKDPISRADVIVAQPQWPAAAAWLRGSRARVAFDLYDPEVFENLEFFAASGQRLPGLWTTLTVDRLSNALHRGDFFMCATESQRDLWLGAMVAERVVKPKLYARDATLRSFIDTVPFGLPEASCERVPGGGIWDHIPGLNREAEVVLWNGGIWGWLDAPTVIRAVASVRESRPRTALVFMGSSDHPAAAAAAQDARSLAESLGLRDSGVHFHSGWVPYEQRANWLLDASCAVSAHADHLETRFAFRTRMLDCFWSRLPIVCTEGDALADLVKRRGLGATARAQDVDSFSTGLHEVLGRGRASFESALAEVAAEHTWQRVAEPLVAFARTAGESSNGGAMTGRAVVRARSWGYRAAASAMSAVQRVSDAARHRS
jgi:glycosyltransferase involved in cell wall biosynthesis